MSIEAGLPTLEQALAWEHASQCAWTASKMWDCTCGLWNFRSWLGSATVGGTAQVEQLGRVVFGGAHPTAAVGGRPS